MSHLWFSSSRKKANIFFFAVFSEFSQWVGYLRSRGLSLQFKYLPVEVIFYFSHGLLGNPLSIATPELFLFSRLDFSTFVIAGPSSETRTIGRTTSGVQTPSTSRKSICFKLTLELLRKMWENLANMKLMGDIAVGIIPKKNDPIVQIASD